jgi:hypothetical protein
MPKNHGYELRKILYESQSGLCDICGAKLHIDAERHNSKLYLQIDHISPGDKFGDVRGLCKSCNSRRGNYTGDVLRKTIRTKNKRFLDEYHIAVWRIKDDIRCGIFSAKDVEEIKSNFSDTMQDVKILLEGINCTV